MPHYDAGLWRADDPHVDEYFADEEAPDMEPGLPEIVLALAHLTEKQRFVIECRYGLRGPPLAQDEIAALMGITQQAILRIENRALASMRRGL